MGDRKPLSSEVELLVLVSSRRRCCICYGLHKDLAIKQGQIAHLNRDASDISLDNLSFLCLPHHDWFDTRTSQSKGATTAEAKHYRDELYNELKRRDELEAQGASPPAPSQLAPPPAAAAAKPWRAVSWEPSKFHAIDVYDTRLNLRWIIRTPPQQWLSIQDPVRSLSAAVVMQCLDGPYHSAAGCNERVEEINADLRSDPPSFMNRCAGCGCELFRFNDSLDSPPADAWTVRAQVLAELQRMNRNGSSIEGPRVELERPLYWQSLLPPRGARR